MLCKDGARRFQLFDTIAQSRTGIQASDSKVHAPLELFLKLLLGTARIGLWLGVALYITKLFSATRYWSNQAIGSMISTFTAPELALGNRAFSLIDLFILIALLFSVIILVGVLTNFLRCRILQSAGINRGLQEVIATLTKYGVITILTVILLQLWGLDLSSLTIWNHHNPASRLHIPVGVAYHNDPQTV